ncbi:MAG: hypothetical protein OQK76_02265 [Gammaproteobacteria bacterium]|nr:hypothetical protein [Gammaproteobacteria bacterium]MCW8909423.1 hypothetical protein [Gammaproteobacteria bacterium]MCW9003726.1 hypothetical protein [Gammaproteobacteria bacterium]MCW9056194.1 hypothetical protein [Gammaproteobacteria bacterium]
MQDEKIKVRVTETDQLIDVVVYSKKASQIEVIIGEGIHSTKCKLTPVDTGLGYAGNVMGREIIYERSREQVQADIDNALPSTRRR